MTFGYDSTLAFSSSMVGLDDFALDWLDRLSAKRRSEVTFAEAGPRGGA